jgi:hypothetical protein
MKPPLMIIPAKEHVKKSGPKSPDTVGQAVSFFTDPGQEHTRSEPFEIVRLLPEGEGAHQYCIKSQTSGHERVVREDQFAGQ